MRAGVNGKKVSSSVARWSTLLRPWLLAFHPLILSQSHIITWKPADNCCPARPGQIGPESRTGAHSPARPVAKEARAGCPKPKPGRAGRLRTLLYPLICCFIYLIREENTLGDLEDRAVILGGERGQVPGAQNWDRIWVHSLVDWWENLVPDTQMWW